MKKFPNLIWNYFKYFWRFHHIFVAFLEYINFSILEKCLKNSNAICFSDQNSNQRSKSIFFKFSGQIYDRSRKRHPNFVRIRDKPRHIKAKCNYDVPNSNPVTNKNFTFRTKNNNKTQVNVKLFLATVTGFEFVYAITALYFSKIIMK